MQLLPQRKQRRVVKCLQGIPDAVRRRRTEIVIGGGVLRWGGKAGSSQAVRRRSIELLRQLLRALQRAPGGFRIAEAKLRRGQAGQQDAVRLVKEAGSAVLAQAGEHGAPPPCDIAGRAVVAAVRIHVQIAEHRAQERDRVIQQRLRQERQRLLRALAVRRQRQADEIVVQPACVVVLQQRDGLLRVAQRQQNGRRLPADRSLVDLRVGILREQQAAALQQLQRAVQKRLFLRLHAEHGVQQRAAIDDVKRIRVFFQGLLRLREARTVLFVAAAAQARDRRRQAVVLHLIAEQRVDRGVKKIRQLQDRGKLRRRLAGLPLVDRPDRHVEHLGKLLLRQPPRPAKRTDVLGKLHSIRLPSVCAIIVARMRQKRNG